MLRLVADHNFNEPIVLGLRAYDPPVDVFQAKEVGLSRAKDPAILAWAAENGRVVLTHDKKTFLKYAYQRMIAGLPMLGVIIMSQRIDIGLAIEQIAMAALTTDDTDLAEGVLHIPL
jgi:hypothetical protein